MYLRFFVVCLLAVAHTASADVSTELANGVSLEEIISNAKDDGVPADQIVTDLLQAGVGVSRTVQTTVRVYDDCTATEMAVKSAVANSPESATDTIRSIATLRECGCSGERHWQRTRVRNRIRSGLDHLVVRMPELCGCVAMAVETAAYQLPSRLSELVDAAMEATPTKSELVMADPSLTPMRLADGTPVLLPSAKAESCDDQGNCEDVDGDLVVSNVILNSSGESIALELKNQSGQDIDLEANGYRVEFYFEDYPRPGHTVPLAGAVAADQTYLIASLSAPQSVLANADQEVPILDARATDAVQVRNKLFPQECGCSEVSVTSAIRGAQQYHAENGATDQEQAMLLASGFGGKVVDVFGQLGANPGSSWDAGSHNTVENTLQRQNLICEPDANYSDDFQVASEWDALGALNTGAIGNHQVRCATPMRELMLSKYMRSEKQENVLEIYNGTNKVVDLGAEQYVLEIYNSGDIEAELRLDMQGLLAPGAVHVVAHPNAPDEVKEIADTVTSDLDFSPVDTLVLRKVYRYEPLTCSNTVMPYVEQLQAGLVELIPDTPPDPLDPNPIVRHRPIPPGGDNASPN